MSNRPLPTPERENKAAPARQRDNAAEPFVADESTPADNRYAPASGILTPVQQPMPGAQ